MIRLHAPLAGVNDRTGQTWEWNHDNGQTTVFVVESGPGMHRLLVLHSSDARLDGEVLLVEEWEDGSWEKEPTFKRIG